MRVCIVRVVVVRAGDLGEMCSIHLIGLDHAGRNEESVAVVVRSARGILWSLSGCERHLGLLVPDQSQKAISSPRVLRLTDGLLLAFLSRASS